MRLGIFWCIYPGSKVIPEKPKKKTQKWPLWLRHNAQFWVVGGSDTPRCAPPYIVGPPANFIYKRCKKCKNWNFRPPPSHYRKVKSQNILRKFLTFPSARTCFSLILGIKILCVESLSGSTLLLSKHPVIKHERNIVSSLAYLILFCVGIVCFHLFIFSKSCLARLFFIFISWKEKD